MLNIGVYNILNKNNASPTSDSSLHKMVDDQKTREREEQQR